MFRELIAVKVTAVLISKWLYGLWSMYWLRVTYRDQHKYILVIYRQLPVTIITTCSTHQFAILGYLQERKQM
jgi:hypothetical protein